MRLEDLPEIRDGDWLSIEVERVYSPELVRMLNTCAPRGVFYGRQIVTRNGTQAVAVAERFGLDERGGLPVLEVYRPINMYMFLLKTTALTVDIPLEKIERCINLSDRQRN
ncbi:hypothetical protein HY490_05745 [Candidatus Woesearchaeota archaeon]|nr:hypothetical protein [Candidatus Woesearchaeota archaeon]